MKMTPYLCAAAFFCVLAILVSVATSRAVPTPRSEINIPKLCEAIKDVENTPHYHVGDAGERSAWQITQDVWEAHSSKPFYWASANTANQNTETKRVLVMHLLWIIRRLNTLSLDDSPYSIALVYKAGYGRCLAHRARLVDKDYANRVSNVYYDTP